MTSSQQSPERYLRNAWYAAMWAEELGSSPHGMKLLEEEVVVYRTEDGAPVILNDRCSHRFTALHCGKVLGDNIQCPYHGLQFGPTGACMLNPHGGQRPSSARIRSYPAAERHGIIWCWMGDMERADVALIPDCSILEDPARSVVRGTLELNADYLLYVDNLMDLSHTEFVHTSFMVQDSLTRTRSEVRQEGEDVIFVRTFPDERAVGPLHAKFAEALGGREGDRVEIRDQVRWMAPAAMLFCSSQIRKDRSANLHALHIVTPTGPGRSRLLWTGIRDFCIEDQQFSQYLRETLESVIEKEDFPPIESQQTFLGSRDLMECNPVLLAVDEAAVRVRRTLSRMISNEQTERADAA